MLGYGHAFERNLRLNGRQLLTQRRIVKSDQIVHILLRIILGVDRNHLVHQRQKRFLAEHRLYLDLDRFGQCGCLLLDHREYLLGNHFKRGVAARNRHQFADRSLEFGTLCLRAECQQNKRRQK